MRRRDPPEARIYRGGSKRKTFGDVSYYRLLIVCSNDSFVFLVHALKIHDPAQQSHQVPEIEIVNKSPKKEDAMGPCGLYTHKKLSFAWSTAVRSLRLASETCLSSKR